MATIFLQVSDQSLLAKLATIIDTREGYVPLRPGYVTQRYADIDTKPDGSTFAYPNDSIVAKHLSAIGDELAKYGISKATATKALQDTQTGAKGSDAISLTSGAYAGVTVQLAAKAADWIPVDK